MFVDAIMLIKFLKINKKNKQKQHNHIVHGPKDATYSHLWHYLHPRSLKATKAETGAAMISLAWMPPAFPA